jgi:hypothetical protein
MMSPTTRKILYWAPRVLGIAYALFLSLFAFDVWGTGNSFWYELAGFLIHLIPVYLVVIAIVIGWRRPRLGGILFLALAVAFTLFFGWREVEVLLALALPLVVIGLLFLANGQENRPQLSPGR